LAAVYRDKAGQWQGTNSLSINDLPKAITALQQAYEYLLSERSETAPEPSEQPMRATGFGPLKPMRV